MNPLCFVTFFTFGEVGMMSALAIGYTGLAPLWQELLGARSVIFWLMLGGFIWVIGDLFQQYAAKYVGISRGIPLSNSNQLWGLLWGIFVFGETTSRPAWMAARLRMSRRIPAASGTGFSSLPPAASLSFLPGWLASREWPCTGPPPRS